MFTGNQSGGGSVGRRLRAALAAGVACAVAGTTAAHGDELFVLVDEGFDDGNRDGWWTFQDSNIGVDVVDDSDGIGTGNALELEWTTNAGSHGIFHQFEGVTLSEVGHKISMNYDVIGTNVGHINGNRTYRFGLYNFDAGDVESDDDWQASMNQGGYWNLIDLGDRNGRVNIRQSRPGNHPDQFSSDDHLLEGNDVDGLDQSPFGVYQDEVSNFTFTIERVGENPEDLEISLAAGGEVASVTLPEGIRWTQDDPDGDHVVMNTFNALAIGQRSHDGSTVRLDNFLVTTNVPEPGSLALLGMGGLAMLARRRKRS